MRLQWRACRGVALAILGVSAACQLARAAETSKVMGNIHTVNGNITLDSHASAAELTNVVGGTLDFDRKVSLYVSDTATIGPVHGATPVKFAGERPPS
jgi:hypothetical protein